MSEEPRLVAVMSVYLSIMSEMLSQTDAGPGRS